MINQSRKYASNIKRSRSGTALLVCLFVVSMLVAMLVAILDTETSKLSAMRNTADYEKALYLAGAGVHQALAELEKRLFLAHRSCGNPTSGRKWQYIFSNCYRWHRWRGYYYWRG